MIDNTPAGREAYRMRMQAARVAEMGAAAFRPAISTSGMREPDLAPASQMSIPSAAQRRVAAAAPWLKWGLLGVGILAAVIIFSRGR